MNNNLKVILTAIGIAVLASPVMARPASHSHAPAAASKEYGSASSPVRTYRMAPAQNGRIHVDDCIRTPFPQCSGGQ
jgi:hypothetical protein